MKGCLVLLVLLIIITNVDLMSTQDASIVSVVSGVFAACNASAPPAHGDIGTCTAQLGSGSNCQPGCDEGYTVSGGSICNKGQLTAATCIPASDHGEC